MVLICFDTHSISLFSQKYYKGMTCLSCSSLSMDSKVLWSCIKFPNVAGSLNGKKHWHRQPQELSTLYLNVLTSVSLCFWNLTLQRLTAGILFGIRADRDPGTAGRVKVFAAALHSSSLRLSTGVMQELEAVIAAIREAQVALEMITTTASHT